MSWFSRRRCDIARESRRPVFTSVKTRDTSTNQKQVSDRPARPAQTKRRGTSKRSYRSLPKAGRPTAGGSITTFLRHRQPGNMVGRCAAKGDRPPAARPILDQVPQRTLRALALAFSMLSHVGCEAVSSCPRAIMWGLAFLP